MKSFKVSEIFKKSRRFFKIALAPLPISFNIPDKAQGVGNSEQYAIEIDFDKQFGSFTLHLLISLDLLSVKNFVDYPYIINYPDRIYEVLRDKKYKDMWLAPLYDIIMLRFHSHYDKGRNPGGFEISNVSKWGFQSLSFKGVELEGTTAEYENYFEKGSLAVQVHGEFALKETRK